MSELKIGDRVEVISVGKFSGFIKVGMKGTVKDTREGCCIGIEFDENMGGSTGTWSGKDGHCWYVDNEYLEKIEETDTEETKAEMLEQKILEVLREEIGVRIGEEFEAYESGEKHWICKFEENGFMEKMNGNFSKSYFWKDIISNFKCFNFKKKPFIPQNGEEYFCLYIKHTSSGVKYLDAGVAVWNGISFDYGMLALGNVFRTKEEAIKNEDKVLERLEELRNGEKS